MIKAIIFDLGNVLLNFDVHKTAERFARECKVPLLKLWIHFLTSRSEKAYARGEISSHEFYARAKKALGFGIGYRTFRRYWNDIFWENEGMDTLLGKLKRRYILCLISNTNRMHYEYIKGKYKVLRHFRYKFPSHEVGLCKPDRKIYEMVFAKTRLDPSETVFVDDIPEFVRAARKTGMHAIRFRSCEQLVRSLRKLGVRV